VLVVPDGSREVLREHWENTGRDAPYVDHVTDDLSGFLHKKCGPRTPTAGSALPPRRSAR
jgi:putative hydrolase of the HAD superfamily